jgi:signal peptidase I
MISVLSGGTGMHDFDDHTQRSTGARIGICLLNLIHPGLGLIRLGRYRAGFAFLALAVALVFGFAPMYIIDPTLTYARMLGVVAALAMLVVVGCGASIALAWRWSALVEVRRGWLWRWYGLLGLCVAFGVLSWAVTRGRPISYHTYFAPSASMVPTIAVGDRFMAQVKDIGPIQRGEVVIVRAGSTRFVKRVAAIPGDTIAMRGGVVILNGTAVPQQPLGPGPDRAVRLGERFPGEARSHELYDLGPSPQDDTPAVTLGAGQYFLLGDNRDNSLDSRFPQVGGGLGIVERSRIEGRVLFRYWRKGSGLGGGEI